MVCWADRPARRTDDGLPKVKQAGAGLDQQAVGMAVVAALELDQHVAAGVAAGQADGAHRRLGAGRNQAHHVHRRHQFAQQVGDLDFLLGRRAEGEAIDDGGLDGGDHLRVGVAEDHRAPGADVVGVPLAVGVLHFGPTPFWKKQGVPPTERKARTGELTPPGCGAGRVRTVAGCVRSWRGSLEKSLILGGAGGDVRRRKGR
jgi:hypothetical protein